MPWVVTTIYAITVKYMQWKERRNRSQDGGAGEEERTRRPVDEETALLGSAPVMTAGIQQRHMGTGEPEKYPYQPSSGPSG